MYQHLYKYPHNSTTIQLSTTVDKILMYKSIFTGLFMADDAKRRHEKSTVWERPICVINFCGLRHCC